MTSTRRPPGLSVAGKKLCDAVTGQFELEPHETLILQNACQTADLVAELQARIAVDGAVLPTGKNHPALSEVRQQRLVLARLLLVLRMPVSDEEDRPLGSGGRFAAFTRSVIAVRRRPRALIGSLPAELVDPTLWPLCPRFDGGEQRCVCWWARRQDEYIKGGGEWPGGPGRELTFSK